MPLSLRMASDFALLTYNMHGFNQGELFLKDICSSANYDVIFLQEHWLNKDGLNKFNIFNDYISFGISAIDDNCVLYGRPYGGVLTMIKKKYSQFIKPIAIRERFVILKLNNFIFINCYFPCELSRNDVDDLLLEITSDLSDCLDSVSYDGIIIAGDFNCNLNNNSLQSQKIKEFLNSYNIGYIDIACFNSSDIDTFGNISRGAFSVIDYVCVSNNFISNSVTNYNVHLYNIFTLTMNLFCLY